MIPVFVANMADSFRSDTLHQFVERRATATDDKLKCVGQSEIYETSFAISRPLF